jgi:uncharacterized protein with HEPN domain
VFSHLDTARRQGRDLVGAGRRAYLGDWKAQEAGVVVVQHVGELIKRLPDDVRRGMPEVPCRKWAGMRDILVHAFHRVDHQLVWETLADDLPRLGAALDRYRARSAPSAERLADRARPPAVASFRER